MMPIFKLAMAIGFVNAYHTIEGVWQQVGCRKLVLNIGGRWEVRLVGGGLSKLEGGGKLAPQTGGRWEVGHENRREVGPKNRCEKGC